jgi:hypothetical protein
MAVGHVQYADEIRVCRGSRQTAVIRELVLSRLKHGFDSRRERPAAIKQ